MKILALLFNFLFSVSAQAKMRSGDLILLPLHCYSCPMIEEETESDFSHSGLLLRVKGKWMVAESLGQVRLTPFDKFIGRVRPGYRPSLYRFEDWRNLDEEKLNLKLLKRLKKEFLGLPFDSDYLWNNFDGPVEKLYCSEMITKLINPFLDKRIPTAPMNFSLYFDFWQHHFPHGVPQGRPGNNPGTFSKASNTFFVEFL